MSNYGFLVIKALVTDLSPAAQVNESHCAALCSLTGAHGTAQHAFAIARRAAMDWPSTMLDGGSWAVAAYSMWLPHSPTNRAGDWHTVRTALVCCQSRL
jgi:hypothetical protein